MDNSSHPGRFARRLRHAVLTFAVLAAFATAIGILLPGAPGRQGAFLAYDGLPHRWAIPIAIGSIGLLLIGLFELGRMLRLVEMDAAFSPQATHHLKRFAGLLMCAVLVDLLAPPAIALSVRGGGTFNIDSSNALLLLLSLLIFLMARLLDMAARYREDSQLIV